MAQPTLKNSLSDLASQLSKIQDENDTIRKRYLELEDAWQRLGAENKELRSENSDLKADNAAKTEALAKAQAQVQALQGQLNEVHESFLQQRNLADGTKKTLVSEQIELGKKTKESDLLRRENVSQEVELRALRESWDERESRIGRLEEQRNFYEEQLSQLAEAYQILVDRVSHVSADYGVKEAPVQVRVGGGYEMLSSYLGKTMDAQQEAASNYQRFAASKPMMSPARSPRAFPMRVSPAAAQ